MITAPPAWGSHDGGVIQILLKASRTATGKMPKAVKTRRKPSTKTAVGTYPSPRDRVKDANASVIGATDVNIIATIITSQVTRNRAAVITAIPAMPMEPL